MAEDSGDLISKDSGSPLWKKFMVTDIERIERVSGEIHARAQPMEGIEMGLLPGKERMARVEANAPEGEKKTDVYHDPEPDPMPKAEIKTDSAPKALGLEGREVFMKPILPFGIEEKSKTQTLPSRSEDLLFGFRKPGLQLGKSGMLISKTKGLNEPKNWKKD
ncbi:MAG: hypothetical protein V1909_01865 [Candidatus Micrarchaeota archaeon]